MKPSDKDAFGDGHGWRLPDRSRPARVTTATAHRFDYDVSKLDQFKVGEEFLGLINAGETLAVRIMFRAEEPIGPGGNFPAMHFLTRHGSEHPHYVLDPIAWARIPTP